MVNESRGILAINSAVMGAVASVLLNYVLIPEYGAKGAAWSCVISFTLAAVISNLIFAPRIFLMQLGIKPRETK
jgi:PST family polysaccharide transporter